MPNASTSTKCEGEIAKRLGSYSMYPVEFRVALGKERGKRLRQADYAVRVTVARCNTCGVELKPKTNSQGFYPNSLDRHSKSNRCRSRSSLSSNASSCSSSTDHSSANPADLSKLHGSRAVHGWFECSCCGTYCLNKEDARDHFTRRCTGEGGEWVDKSNVTSELTRSSHAAKLSSIAWEVMRGAEPITSPEVQSVDEASESLSDSGSTDEGMQSVSQAHSPPSSYQPCDDAASIPDSPLLFDADEIPKCFSVGNEVLVTPSFADGLNDAVNLNESCMDFGQPLKRIRSNSNDEDDFQLASELGLVEESDAFSNDEFSFYLNRLQQEHSVNSSSTTNTDHLGYLCSTHYDGAEVELGSEISMQFHVPGVLWDESLTLVNTGSVQDGIQYVEESVSITQSESRTPQCTVQLRAKVSGRANDDLYGYWRLARRSTNQEEVLHVGPMLWVHLVAVEQSQPAARVEVENEVGHGNSNHNFAPSRDASVPEDISGEESTSLGPESGGLTATNPQQSVSLREVQQPNFEAMLLEEHGVSQPGEAVENLESTLVQLNDAQRDDSYELDTELMQHALLPLGQDLAQTVRISVYNDQVQAVEVSVEQHSHDQSQRGVDVSVQQTVLSDQVRHADDSMQNDQQQIGASVPQSTDQSQRGVDVSVQQTILSDQVRHADDSVQNDQQQVGASVQPSSDQLQREVSVQQTILSDQVRHADDSVQNDQQQIGASVPRSSDQSQRGVDVSVQQTILSDQVRHADDSVQNAEEQQVGASVQPSSDQSQRGVDVSVQQTVLSDQVRHADDSVQNAEEQQVGASVPPNSDQLQREVSVQQTVLNDQVRHADGSVYESAQNDQQQSVLSNQQEPINASVQELLQKDQKQQVSQTCTPDNGKQFAHHEQERHVNVFSHPTSLDQVQNVAETVQHAGHYSTHSDHEEQTGLPLQSTSLNKQQRVDVSVQQSVHKDLCDSGNASVLQPCSLDQERQVAHGGSEQQVDVSVQQSVHNDLCDSGNESVLQPCSLDQERQVAHGGSEQQVDVPVQQSVHNDLCGSGNASVQHFGSENEITLVSPDQVREQVTLWLKGNDSCILSLVNVESRKHATVVQEALRGFTHLQVPCGNSNSLEYMQQCVCSWRNQFCEVLPVEFAQLCAEQNHCASTNVKELLLQSLKQPLIGLEQSCQMAIDPVMFVLDLQDKEHLSSDLVRNLIGVFAAVETPQWLKLLVVTDGEFVPNMMNVVQGANLAIKVIQVDELESALLTKVQAVSDQWIQAATDPNDASVGLPQAGFTTHLLLYLLFLIQLLQLVGQILRSPRKAIHHVLFGSCQVLMTALKTLVNVDQRGNLLSIERLAVLMASVKQIVHAARNVERNRDDQSNHFVDVIGPSGKERDRNMKHNQITQNTKKTQYYHSSECVSQGILVATHSSGCKPEILLSLRQAVTHCVQQQLKTTVSLQAIQKLSSAIGVSVQQCETVLMSLINGAFVDADTWSSKTQALLLRAAEPSLSFWQLSAWFSSADENPQSSSVFDENAARFWEQVSQLLADATVCSFPQDIDAAQCRSIWWFQLHPLIRTEKWSNEEQDRLWRMVHALNPSCGDRSVQVEQLGISTWAKVSKQLPGRTPEQVRAKVIASIGKERDSNSSIFAK